MSINNNTINNTNKFTKYIQLLWVHYWEVQSMNKTLKL